MNALTLVALLVVFALGAGVGRLYTSHRRKAGAHALKPPAPPVRDAGPENIEAPPRRWDNVDQQADESFPASDPPGNY
jgi:hypothetical protein